MTKRRAPTITTETPIGPDVDLEREDVRLADGTRLTPEVVESIVEEVRRPASGSVFGTARPLETPKNGEYIESVWQAEADVRHDGEERRRPWAPRSPPLLFEAGRRRRSGAASTVDLRPMRPR